MLARRLLMASGGSGAFTVSEEPPPPPPPPGVNPEGTGQGDSGLAGTSLTKLGVVIDRGAAGAWDDSLVESPAVWWDDEQGQYGMVYVGYGTGHGSGAIGLAWADDPAGPWTKAGKILDGSGSGADSAGCSGPFIWNDGTGTYHLYYIGLTDTGYENGTKSLCHATSTDLATWTRLGSIIVPTTGWRSDAIWHPCVIKDGSTYYLFFNANGASELVGYATSSDLDTWTVDDVHSPLTLGGESRNGDPSLYLVGSTWWMAYYTLTTGASDSLAYATSFPTTWAAYAGNPVLVRSEPYDSDFAHKPYIFQTDAGMWHYYTAVASGGIRTIAVAEATV